MQRFSRKISASVESNRKNETISALHENSVQRKKHSPAALSSEDESDSLLAQDHTVPSPLKASFLLESAAVNNSGDDVGGGITSNPLYHWVKRDVIEHYFFICEVFNASGKIWSPGIF
jgi:hypothetical protein